MTYSDVFLDITGFSNAKRPASFCLGTLPRPGHAVTITIMAMTVTIDGAGRLVVPLVVRKRLNLRNGSRLSLVADEDRILLEPERTESVATEREGILVLQGELAGEIPDHRRLREERVGRLAKP